MQKHILVVDDNATNLHIAENSLKPEYKLTLLLSGEQALKFLSRNKPDLILLDISMPGMDGFETIKRIKENPDTANIPVVFLTAMSASESEVKGLQLGAADFIAKPFVPEVMLRRVSMQIELASYRNQLEKMVDEKTTTVEKLQDVIVSSITELVEFRDTVTGGHARRSKDYLEIFVHSLAKEPEYKDYLTPEMINNILRAGPLHDVGKIGINDDILNKDRGLSSIEYEYMKQHTINGGEAFKNALKQLPGNQFLEIARDMALYHHEHWDGNGYPEHRKGENIPLSARIMAIADVYDALTTKRSYKEPYSHEDAINIMTSASGTQFDPKLIEVFLKCSEEFRILCNSFKEE